MRELQALAIFSFTLLVHRVAEFPAPEDLYNMCAEHAPIFVKQQAPMVGLPIFCLGVRHTERHSASGINCTLTSRLRVSTAVADKVIPPVESDTLNQQQPPSHELSVSVADAQAKVAERTIGLINVAYALTLRMSTKSMQINPSRKRPNLVIWYLSVTWQCRPIDGRRRVRTVVFLLLARRTEFRFRFTCGAIWRRTVRSVETDAH